MLAGSKLARGLLNSASGAALAAAGQFAGPSFAHALAGMKRAERLAPEQAARRLDARLGAILQYAGSHVPFYVQHLRGLGVRVEDLDGSEALGAFPVVTKANFRDSTLDPFLASGVPAHRRIARRTSGSTGEPFIHYLDREMLPVIYASHLFYDGWYGLRPFDRYLRISRPLDREEVPRHGPLAARAKQWGMASLKHAYERLTQDYVSVWEVDRRHLDTIYRKIQAFKPDFLLGYTSTLALLAEFLSEEGRPLPRPVRGVVTIGETLTPQRRQAISSCFRAPIIDRYGLREFGAWSAQNCPHIPDEFHVNTELVAAEILRPDDTPVEPGETGRVVLTDLRNRVMPFIRYDTGDLAVRCDGRPCGCGRTFPRIGALQGRSAENLVSPTGRTVSSIVLGRYIRDGGPAFEHSDHIRYIRHYQAVQEGARVRFLVVPNDGFDSRRRELLKCDLERLLGGEMEVAVEIREEIPLEPSGKRPLIKKVPRPSGLPAVHDVGVRVV